MKIGLLGYSFRRVGLKLHSTILSKKTTVQILYEHNLVRTHVMQ